MVSSGERVEVGAVLIDDASLLHSPLARAPQLESRTEPRVVVRRSTDGLDPERVTASLEAFGLTTADWYAANPTLLPGLHQLVASLDQGHSIGGDLWRAEPALLNDEALPAAPLVARVRVTGFDPDANSRLLTQIEGSTRLVVYDENAEADDEPVVNVDAVIGDADETLDPRRYDVLMLGADEPVEQDVLHEALRSALVIVADARWSELLGDVATYVEIDDAVAAMETMLHDPALWRSKLELFRTTASDRFGAQALASVLDRELDRVDAGRPS
jgi:hypothetical protein